MPFVSITRLRVRRWRYVPQFLIQSLRGARQAERAAGSISVSVLREADRAFLRADPAEEILGRLLVLRIAHDEVRERHVIAELASRALRQRGVERVLLERYPFLGEVAFGLAAGQKIN